MVHPLIQVYTQPHLGQSWLHQVEGQCPILVLTLGFTATGLIAGISAAGATPSDRQVTALADAECLVNGLQLHPRFPLPPLQAGASPALISRAVIAAQQIPLKIFNAGLPQSPTVPCVDLGGQPAQCLSTGAALPWETVQHLWQQGLAWGERLASDPCGYLLLAECVVGGTTTALGLLTGLGVAATGRVNSSHPTCNHDQKQQLVAQGLRSLSQPGSHPLEVVAAVGDPMQPLVAAMAMAASRFKPVMLAGGTQMLAVYALITAMARMEPYPWNPANVVVGTTRWVAEDPTGDTVGLARLVGASLLATQLSFQASDYPALQAYEAGFVKEGVGAGACAIAASLYQNWGQADLVTAIEQLLATKAKIDQTLSGKV